MTAAGTGQAAAELPWEAAVLGLVVFLSVLALLIQLLTARQEHTGRMNRVLRTGAVPAAVPAVTAAVAGAATAALARASFPSALVLTGLVAAGATTALLLGGRSRGPR